MFGIGAEAKLKPNLDPRGDRRVFESRRSGFECSLSPMWFRKLPRLLEVTPAAAGFRRCWSAVEERAISRRDLRHTAANPDVCADPAVTAN